VTSAVDIITPKPAARPEPVAKASSRDDDRASFTDALNAETSEPEAVPTKEVSKEAAPNETASKDEPAAPDTNIAAQPAQPQQQPTPAVNSPEAILAGLTQAAPTDAPAAEAGAATPAIDAAAAAAAPAGAAENSAAAAAQAAPKPAATPQADATSEETAQAVAPANTAVAKPAAPTQPALAAPAPATDAAPLSAPGEERTSATVEAANTSSNKATAPTTSTAADPAASKAQGAQAKTTQAATNFAAEAAPDIKTDAAPPAPTTALDALATAARSGAETARTTQANPALQNAPATTIQVYQRMVERFDGRAQRYEVRLDPAELGRVDVRIEVGADKKVHAVLAAHDSAALSDLMRGQRTLERALNDAGFDLAEGGIRFELSSDQGRNPANNSNGNDGNGRSNVWRGFNTLDVAVDAQTAAAARPWRSTGRLDVVA